MKLSVYRISLDVHDAHSSVCLDMKQEDTARQIAISLTDGGFPYQISEECYAVFAATKADGTKLLHHCSITRNTILYDVRPQTTAAVGLCECEIRLYGSGDKLLLSPGFNILVSENAVEDEEEIVSEDEVDALTHLISEATTVITEGEEVIAKGEEVNAEAEALIEGMETKRATLEQQIADTAASAGAANKSALRAESAASSASSSASLATTKAKAAADSADSAKASEEAAKTSASTATTMASNAYNHQKAAEAAAQRAEEAAEKAENGNNSSQNPTVATVEPAYEDIPKVFFGGALPQNKTETVMPFRYISKTMDVSGYCKIKAQGNSSMAYPKKNETVKMYKDAECEEKLKINFKGWGKQNKVVGKANWIDLSHSRNIVTCWLWADMVKSRSNYLELPELYRTSPNHGAIDGFPVKVYSEGVYQGRFTLNIPKDAWMANMDDELETHCILYSENYDSGCFLSEAKIDGSDWSDEVHDTVPDSIKTRWNEIINFIQNSTDEEFIANLGNYFDVPSLIDYDLLGLLSCDLDGFGKNQFYLTYDGQKWIAGVYDKDATWGLYWNGGYFVATDYPRESYEDHKTNLLYNRLEQLFSSELKARWAELKNGALSMPNIINRFERFMDITPDDLVKEDYAETTANGAYIGIPSRATNNIQQIRSFALARTAWVTDYLNNIVYTPCTGITLSASELTFTAEGSQTLIATVTPEDCSDAVTWESNNASVATVDNGVVTAVANGSAVITAKCGSKSASCAVSVSGLVEAVPCTGITLSTNTLSFTAYGSQTLTATVTPDGCTDPIVWESDKPAVATVADGVVTAVGNGVATITAKCGNYSATCSVSVTKEAVTTVLFENQAANANTFAETEINFAAGDYIEAEIDVSKLTGYNVNPLIRVMVDSTDESAGTAEVNYNPNNATENVNVTVQWRESSRAWVDVKYAELPQTITVKVNSEGVTLDGELYTPDDCTYPVNGWPGVNALNAASKVYVGVNKTASPATYNYVKVVRV